MEEVGSTLGLVGFVFLLVSASIVFLSLISWIFGKMRNPVLMSVQVVVLLTLVLWLIDDITVFTGLEGESGEFTVKAINAMLWLSGAYTFNAALNRYIWKGILAKDGYVWKGIFAAQEGVSNVPKLLTDFATVFIYITAIMSVMYFVYEKPITAVAATSGAFAFVIGYSAQSTLGEIFAGLSLNLSQDLRKGDMILIDGVRGEVRDINWRSVSVYEWPTESVVVFPNNIISSLTFKNLSRPTLMSRYHKDVTIEYSAPPELARRAIEEAFEGSRIVLRDPAPLVYVDNINDLGTTLRVFFSFPDFSVFPYAIEETNRIIWNGLRKYGIRPALKRYHLGDRFDLPEEPWDIREKESPESVQKMLAKALQVLSDPSGLEEVWRTKEKFERFTFNPPDKIGDHAALGRSLFLVVSGTVSLTRAEESNNPVEIQVVREGELTNIPSIFQSSEKLTTAWAKTYCVVYEIPKVIIEELSNKYPNLDRQLALQSETISDKQDRCFEQNRMERTILAHEKKRQLLVNDLTREVGIFFRKGGVLARMFGASSNDQFLEGAMAATALVAAADGRLTQSEQDYVEKLFESVSLFQYVDRKRGLSRFQNFVEEILRDSVSGQRNALKAIAKLSKKIEVNRLIVDMCIAVSAADENIDQSEVQAILKICDVLSVVPPKNFDSLNSDPD